jgi:tyrosyl-tRNA synthetase
LPNQTIQLTHGQTYAIDKSQLLKVGDQVVLVESQTDTNTPYYQIIDRYRLTNLWPILTTFFVLVILLSRKQDMFQKRISEGKDLYLSEFLYPVLQGYDSVAMNVDGEIGGNDQTFNMLMGRDLLKKLNDKEKVVISMRLLVDSTGKKMGKTEGNMVSLNEKPDEIFGKVMSWSDDFILPVFELCTTMPLSEIADIKKSLESGVNPRDLKLRLAEKVVAVYYGDKKAKVAKENFLKTFSKGEIPDEIPEIESEKGSLLSECLLKTRLISSKSEWRRLVGENAVGFLESDGKVVKILDFNFKVESSAVFKVGKHRFLKVTTK